MSEARAVAAATASAYICGMNEAVGFTSFQPSLNERNIALLVQTFYGRAREDDLLGPVFNAAVADWDHHLAQLTDFWSSMMLKTGRYNGRPMRPHLMLPLTGAHFDRWLSLFEPTVREIFDADVADAINLRARRIADSFEMGVATTRGEIARPRHSV
jgi:hemoglobin